jgi:hypothetical protein
MGVCIVAGKGTGPVTLSFRGRRDSPSGFSPRSLSSDKSSALLMSAGPERFGPVKVDWWSLSVVTEFVLVDVGFCSGCRVFGLVVVVVMLSVMLDLVGMPGEEGNECINSVRTAELVWLVCGIPFCG